METHCPRCLFVCLFWADATLPAAEAVSGSLVAEFGTGGIQTAGSSTSAVTGLVVQSDGKIVVAHEDTTLLRFLSDGSPDTSFGTGGVMVYNTGNADDFFDLAVQADGKLVPAGAHAISGRQDLLAVRYKTDSTLDTGFGSSGSAIVSLFVQPSGYKDISAHAICIQPDGKLLLGGFTQERGAVGSSWLTMRFQTSGQLDTSFGTNGRNTRGLANYSSINDLALEADGSIIQVGYFSSTTRQAGVGRLTSTGSTDDTFSAPLKLVDGSRNSEYHAVVINPDGQIVCAGQISGPGRMLISRYFSSGELDTTFGNEEGHAMLEPGGIIRDVQVLPNGKYMICGESGASAFVGRLLDNGRFDPSFSPDASGYILIPELTYAKRISRLTEDTWVVAGRNAGPGGGMALAAVNDGPPNPPWIVLTLLPATPVSQSRTLEFSPAAPETSGGSQSFKVSNAGDITLTGLEISVEGGDFTVSPLETTELDPGASTTITVTFTPSGNLPLLRQSLLKVHTGDPSTPLFQVQMEANVLSFTEDSDGDGLNDASEYQLRLLGFDYQSMQEELVQTLFNNIEGALPNLNNVGIYSGQQIHTLQVGGPILTRHPETGRYTLKLALETSSDLKTFTPLSFTAPETTVTPEGKLEFEFETTEEASFYRVITD